MTRWVSNNSPNRHKSPKDNLRRWPGEKAGRAREMRVEAFFHLDFFAYFFCLRKKV